jgi:hypothetical protein
MTDEAIDPGFSGALTVLISMCGHMDKATSLLAMILPDDTLYQDINPSQWSDTIGKDLEKFKAFLLENPDLSLAIGDLYRSILNDSDDATVTKAKDNFLEISN